MAFDTWNMPGRNFNVGNAECLAVGGLEKAHMRPLEKRNKRHASNKTANMCHISHIAADLSQVGKLQHNPAAKHEKCRHIHYPEKNQNANNATDIGAWMQQQMDQQMQSVIHQLQQPQNVFLVPDPRIGLTNVAAKGQGHVIVKMYFALGNFPNPNGMTFRAENGKDTWTGLCFIAKPRANPSASSSRVNPSVPS